MARHLLKAFEVTYMAPTGRLVTVQREAASAAEARNAVAATGVSVRRVIELDGLLLPMVDEWD
jgi:predicted O-methyltransferase YrrM